MDAVQVSVFREDLPLVFSTERMSYMY